MEPSHRPVSLLLTVLPTSASRGELVWRAQVIASGEVVPLRSWGELGQLLERLGRLDPDTPPTPTC